MKTLIVTKEDVQKLKALPAKVKKLKKVLERIKFKIKNG